MAKSCLPLAVLAGTMVLGLGCGGEDSVASQSARAFREAQARGETVSGGQGHEHGAASPATADEAPSGEHADHEPAATAPTHDAAEAHSTTATDHTAANDASASAARPDDHAHAGHSGGTPAPTAAPRATTTVDHAAMGHGAAEHAHAPPSLAAIESQSALPPATPVPPGAPAKTLAPDALDAPAYELDAAPTPPYVTHPGGAAVERRQP